MQTPRGASDEAVLGVLLVNGATVSVGVADGVSPMVDGVEYAVDSAAVSLRARCVVRPGARLG